MSKNKKIEVFDCSHSWGKWKTIYDKVTNHAGSWLLVQERICMKCGMRQVKKDVL